MARFASPREVVPGIQSLACVKDERGTCQMRIRSTCDVCSCSVPGVVKSPIGHGLKKRFGVARGTV